MTTKDINVKDFGAIGDGIANDRLAVRAAMKEAERLRLLGICVTVIFPAGTYNLLGNDTDPLGYAPLC